MLFIPCHLYLHFTWIAAKMVQQKLMLWAEVTASVTDQRPYVFLVYEFYVNCGHTNDFIPFTGTRNSTNWPAPNIWVFIAQLAEYCSANAEAMGSNPVEAPKTFCGLNCDFLNRNHNCDDHTFISYDFKTGWGLTALPVNTLNINSFKMIASGEFWGQLLTLR